MSTYLGMTATDRFDKIDPNLRPKNYRDTILYLYPNGMAPLTALTSRMSSESTDDPEFNWWTQTFENQSAAVTGVYKNSSLAAAYTGTPAAAKGSILYFKTNADGIRHFREGHQVLLRRNSDVYLDTNGKVVQAVTNGDNSYVAVKLLEADGVNSATSKLNNVDHMVVIGNINAEGASMPDSISYAEKKVSNLTQIFRTPLDITRTAKKTRLRTGDRYNKLKKEALMYHGVEMERAFLLGIRTEEVGSNGHPERTTQGLIPFIRQNAPDNVFDVNSAPSGFKWLDSGFDWFEEKLEKLFQYGSKEKMVYCGNGALLAINKLVRNKGQFDISVDTIGYGIKVTRVVTVFGVLDFISHPLFTQEPLMRNSAVVFEPNNVVYRYVDDTAFIPDKSSGKDRVDGQKEEYLTEAGLEFHHPRTGAVFYNLGNDVA